MSTDSKSLGVSGKGGNKKSKFHFDHLYLHHPQIYDSIVLYQIGDLYCEGGYVIGEHVQSCYEISYIVSGKGYFFTDHRPYAVEEGDIILNMPGELHDGRADAQEPFRYFYVGFGFADPLDESMAEIKHMFDRTKRFKATNRTGVDLPFLGIFGELINDSAHSAQMIKTYLYQLVVQAYRSLLDGGMNAYAPAKDEEQKRLVYEVIHYIDVNAERLDKLSGIGKELNYSYSYLSHLFTRETGLTIRDYYNRKRFEKAVEWLARKELSISQIAEKLHYQSIHTFSKAFRKKFGMAPSEYSASVSAKK